MTVSVSLSVWSTRKVPVPTDISKCTRAWQNIPVQNSFKTRRRRRLFSSVSPQLSAHRGSADTARDPRGFAVKFYTEDGNYDLVGNNLPVFFIRDAIKFPDMVHSFKPAPDTGYPTSSSANSRFWDFISLTPESTHMITWLFSDRGTVKSYRKMEGFGVNTYKWVNANGKAVYVKYHWKPKAGIETIDRHESTRLSWRGP